MLRKHGGPAPRAQLLAVPDVLSEMFAGGSFNGCFFVNVAVQFPHPDDPAHQAAVAHKHAMEEIIRELAGYAGADDAAAFAEEMSLVMEGAYVTCQVTKKPQTAQIARRLVDLVVNRRLPASRPPGGDHGQADGPGNG